MAEIKTNMSKHARILRLFKEKRRLTQQDLNRISYRYGGIIHELRKEGHEIVTICIDATKGQYEYQYKRGPAKPVKKGEVLDSHKLNYEELPKSNFFTDAMRKLKR